MNPLLLVLCHALLFNIELHTILVIDSTDFISPVMVFPHEMRALGYSKQVALLLGNSAVLP
jgi:hypothetical protein